VSCEHLVPPNAGDPEPVTLEGCVDCLAEGRKDWVHLRLCLTCGNIGCCDSSPRRHASAHFAAVGHPVVRSFEPGESWRWCYIDEVVG
jgi:CPA1 family monovalent cation:H+ antiporter